MAHPPTAKPVWPFPHRARLTAHPNGQWCKKIRGVLYYFGPWHDPQAALDKFLREQEDLYAGRTPPPPASALSVRDLCNAFLTHKHERFKAGEISASMFGDYKRTAEQLAAVWGGGKPVDALTPEDFAALRRALPGGLVTKCSQIGWVRSFFKYALSAGLTRQPPRYGSEFSKPSKRAMRLHRLERRAARGRASFEPAEVHALLAAASPAMRAMILLGVNGGFGNTDCAALRRADVALDRALIEMPRPKTGIERTCPLWPETVAALRAYQRPAPRAAGGGDDGLFFLTRHGRAYVRDRVVTDADGVVQEARSHNGIVLEFTRLMKGARLDGKPLRPRGFYCLRHTFRTVADAVHDPRAIDRVMGHVSEHVSAEYVEAIDLGRLRAVVDHVHAWLYQGGAGSTSRSGSGSGRGRRGGAGGNRASGGGSPGGGR